MTNETDAKPGPSRRLVLVGTAALAVGAGAVYGIKGFGGNSAVQSGCENAVQAAARAGPFAKGEVASFGVAKSPITISDLAFKDGEGTAMTIADFKGQTVLLNLWATWCAPCRHEMPALDRLQAKLGSEKFKVVAVNIDTGNPQKPIKFLKDIKAESLSYYADNTMGVFNTLKSRGRAFGMPTTMLVGPNGCEIGTMAGPAEWDSEDAIALIKAAAEIA